jgi:hypothetical protein
MHWYTGRVKINRVGQLIQATLAERLEYYSEDGPPPPKHPNLGPCRLWTGCTLKGYGRITISNGSAYQSREAYRESYILVNGPVADGMDVAHRCEVNLCIRATHLEAQTRWENVLYGRAFATRGFTCTNGHPWTPENTYFPPRGGRQCRTCNRDACRRYHRRKTGL